MKQYPDQRPIFKTIASQLGVLWRGLFWAALLLFFGVGCQPQAGRQPLATAAPVSGATVIGQREYVVRQRMELVNDGPGQPDKQNLWVALIQSCAALSGSPVDGDHAGGLHAGHG